MTKKYFLNKETKTGLCVAYDSEHGDISVRGTCHVWADMHANGPSLVCDHCSKIYSGSIISECIIEWATDWNVSSDKFDTAGTITRWASAWTGIDPERMKVKVDL